MVAETEESQAMSKALKQVCCRPMRPYAMPGTDIGSAGPCPVLSWGMYHVQYPPRVCSSLCGARAGRAVGARCAMSGTDSGCAAARCAMSGTDSGRAAAGNELCRADDS
eukprot:824271-Rhodomonas_salina.1